MPILETFWPPLYQREKTEGSILKQNVSCKTMYTFPDPMSSLQYSTTVMSPHHTPLNSELQAFISYNILCKFFFILLLYFPLHFLVHYSSSLLCLIFIIIIMMMIVPAYYSSCWLYLFTSHFSFSLKPINWYLGQPKAPFSSFEKLDINVCFVHVFINTLDKLLSSRHIPDIQQPGQHRPNTAGKHGDWRRHH